MAVIGIDTEDVILRLDSLGYKLDGETQSEAVLCGMALDKAIFTVRRFCNISELPKELYPALLDLAAAEFLSFKYFSSVLDGEDAFIGRGVKELKEGDISVTFFSGDDDSGGVRSVISRLKEDARRNLYSFRRLAF